METLFGIIIGRLTSLLDGLFSHWIVDRSSGEKALKENFRAALDELEKELHRLLTRINSSDFENIGFESWSRDILERKWKAVQQYLSPEIERKVSCEASNGIGCLGAGAERQWMERRLTDFLNKVTWLINIADDVYAAGSKDRKKK